jgi:toxin ParE1/3/4
MIASAAWYEEQRTGTGARFLAEVARYVDLIGAHPGIGTLILDRRRREVRAMVMRSFPYRIIYRPTPEVLIVAVAHTSRRPNYWAKRL